MTSTSPKPTATAVAPATSTNNSSAATNALPKGGDFKSRQRKRAVVIKNDPESFRDALLELLVEDATFETYVSVLESNADKLDYKRYADTFFEVVIVGGIVAPGGEIVDDGAAINQFSIFACEDAVAPVRLRVDMINKLIRRYKYLQRKLEETLMHLLQYSSKFGAANSHKLATTVGLCVSTQLVPLAVVSTLLKEHLVKDGTSAAFLTAVFQTYLLDQSVDSLTMTLGRIGLVDDKVAEFFPQGKRSEETVAKHFEASGLKALNEYFKKRRCDAVKDAVRVDMKELIEAGKSQDELIAFTREAVKTHGWNEAETAVFLWDTVIASVEWSTKADNFETQLVKILNTYAKLLEAFCNSPKTEISLLQRVQTVCYQDARFIKYFRTIATTFYKHDIVSEAAVIYWFEKGGALSLGKTVFLKQMEPFVEWLKAQEEESDEEDE